MATTTNYGWTTPDDTALVKDGAAAIRTLGSSVDTTTKNLNPSTTLGDIEYRSSTANTNTRLGIGSTGNVLTVAGGVPTWSAPAGVALTTGYVNTLAYEGTSSTSYTDLSTVTSVTVTTGTKALVFFGAVIEPTAAGLMSFAVSGASTVAVSDDNSITVAGAVIASGFRVVQLTGLTAGSNVFTAKFKAPSGTTYYQRRVISVIDLGS